MNYVESTTGLGPFQWRFIPAELVLRYLVLTYFVIYL
jgi:hypothetical protein